MCRYCTLFAFNSRFAGKNFLLNIGVYLHRFTTDKLDKCQLDCSLDLLGSSAADISSCYDGCTRDFHKCKDTPAATACFDCALDCSVEYNDALRACLSEVAREKMLVKTMPHCESVAATNMDNCMASCQK